MSKNKVKLLLNLCLLADAAIPRGGVISVSSTGEDERVAFRIEAKGVNARVASNVPRLLEGESEEGAIDARAVQAYYAGLVAKSCGLQVVVSSEPELVTIEAAPMQAQTAGSDDSAESAAA
jgi:histidine phosphotransferase ChpT